MNIAILGLPLLLLLIAAIVGAGYLIVRRPKIGLLLVGVGAAVLALLFLGVRQRQVAVVESHRSHVVEEQALIQAQAGMARWRMAIDQSAPVARYACRELACRALARQIVEQIQELGLAPAEGMPPLELAVEMVDPLLQPARHHVAVVLRSVIAQRWPADAKPVRIRWMADAMPRAVPTTQEANRAVLRWSETNDGPEKRVVAVLEAGSTRASLSALHADKSWVLDELPQSRDANLVVVGRSGLVPWQDEARDAALADAQRQIGALASAGNRDPVAMSVGDPDVIDECVQEVAEQDGTQYMAAVLVRAVTQGSPADADVSSRAVLPKGYVRSDVARIVLTVAALFAMVALAYLFLDAGTKGYYTWPLRVGAALAFAVLCVIVMKAFGR
ncbi:MAG: hypothetical protein JXA69_02475 [Phycisphaerae bacterium]|nr:hypothetical protein [Phycisphaerae bacterium]